MQDPRGRDRSDLYITPFTTAVLKKRIRLWSMPTPSMTHDAEFMSVWNPETVTRKDGAHSRGLRLLPYHLRTMHCQKLHLLLVKRTSNLHSFIACNFFVMRSCEEQARLSTTFECVEQCLLPAPIGSAAVRSSQCKSPLLYGARYPPSCSPLVPSKSFFFLYGQDSGKTFTFRLDTENSVLLSRSLSRLSNERIARKACLRRSMETKPAVAVRFAEVVRLNDKLMARPALRDTTVLVVQLAAFEDTRDGSDGVVVFAGLGKRKLQPSSSYICKILPQAWSDQNASSKAKTPPNYTGLANCTSREACRCVCATTWDTWFCGTSSSSACLLA